MLLFAIPLLLFNCEKDLQLEQHLEETGTNDNIFSKKPLKDYANDIAFKKAQSFLEINDEQVNQVNLRIKETRLKAKDSSANKFISLNTKNVARIIRPTYASYTFPINQLKQEDNSFRNLIINVAENKTTAFIYTYIPDEGYLQRKKTDKKASFSGKVYFTEYAENLASLLKSYRLKLQFNKSNTEVCIESFRTVKWPCKQKNHWGSDPECDYKGSDRGGSYTETTKKCFGGNNSFSINYLDHNRDLNIEDPLGVGGPTGATTPLDNVDDDCGGDGFKRNLVGECVKYDCKEENKVYDEITQTCVCEDGYTENIETDKCVKKPCPGDPIRNPEIAPQKKGENGIKRGMFGYTRKKWENKKLVPKFHYGADLKNSLGSPVYATFDGNVIAVKKYFLKAGWIAYLSGNVNGKTVTMQYFHLQQKNRLNGNVKAGDIIGYQGDSGNLKDAIANGGVDSHVHLKAKENGKDVDPLKFLKTKIDTNSGLATSPCN